MEKSKKLSIMIIVIIIAVSIGVLYSAEFIQPNQSTHPNQSEQPSSTHHFQVNVNDTFVIGEKHG